MDTKSTSSGGGVVCGLRGLRLRQHSRQRELIHQKQLGEDGEIVDFVVFHDRSLVTSLIAKCSNSMSESFQAGREKRSVGQSFNSGVQRSLQACINFLKSGLKGPAVCVSSRPAKTRNFQLLSFCKGSENRRRQVIGNVWAWGLGQPPSNFYVVGVSEQRDGREIRSYKREGDVHCTADTLLASVACRKNFYRHRSLLDSIVGTRTHNGKRRVVPQAVRTFDCKGCHGSSL